MGKQNILVVIAVILLLVAIVGGVLLFFPSVGVLLFFPSGIPTMPFSFATGASTLSLSSGTAYVSTDAFFNSPTYSIAMVADGSAGHLSGTFTPAQMGEFTGTHVPTNSFDVTVDILNQSCTYTMQGSSIPVYYYMNGYGNVGVLRVKIGDIYMIDSVAHYDSRINVSLISGGNAYSVMLTPLEKNGQIENVLRTSIIGNLMGDQSCPVPSSNTVLYRPLGQNYLIPKASVYVAGILSIPSAMAYSGQIIAGTSLPNNAAYYNGIVNQFMSSQPGDSAYCEAQGAGITVATGPSGGVNCQVGACSGTTLCVMSRADQVSYYDSGISQYCGGEWYVSGTSTNYQCTPASQVALPLLKMYVKADVLGVVIPSGTPQIVSISAPEMAPGNTTKVVARVKNTATETDAFDLSATGRYPVNIQSSRITLTAGQEQDVDVYVQAAGTIGNYTMTMRSVNNPLAVDTMVFRLVANPFCDREAEAGKVMVNTEFGCYWVCQNTFTNDLREKTCQQFGSFEPRGAYNSLTETTEGNFNTMSGIALEQHCVGIGQYTMLEDYMNFVFNPSVQAGEIVGSVNTAHVFVPPAVANAFWLPAPVCNYVGAYGYHFNTTSNTVTQIGEGDFDYTVVPQNGNSTGTGSIVSCSEGYIPSPGGCILIQQGNETGGGGFVPPSLPQGNDAAILAIAGLVALGLVFSAAWYLGKRK